MGYSWDSGEVPNYLKYWATKEAPSDYQCNSMIVTVGGSVTPDVMPDISVTEKRCLVEPKVELLDIWL